MGPQSHLWTRDPDFSGLANLSLEWALQDQPWEASLLLPNRQIQGTSLFLPEHRVLGPPLPEHKSGTG